MIDYLLDENRKLRIDIWNNTKELSLNHKFCEEKLQELFKYKDFNEYFYKLDKIIAYTDIYKEPKPFKDRIIVYCIEALIEYEFFYSFNIDKNLYDKKKLKQQLEHHKKFYDSSDKIEIVMPKHPNDILKDTYDYLVNECNFNKYGAKRLIKIIFPKDKKISYSKQTEEEYKQLPRIFEDIKNTLVNSPHLNDGFNKKSEKEKKQSLKDLDEEIFKWQTKVNKKLLPIKLK